MVHLVVFVGDLPAVRAVAEQMKLYVQGWIPVNETTWLVGYHQGATVLRDLVGSHAGVDVLVVQLTGGWGTRGLQNVAQWLTGARNAF